MCLSMRKLILFMILSLNFIFDDHIGSIFAYNVADFHIKCILR